MKATVPFAGGKLRSLRVARGWTQAELAHRAHVRERQIIRWENGQHTPRVGSVAALARVLKVPVAELLSESDEDDAEGDPVMELVSAIRAIVRDELARSA